MPSQNKPPKKSKPHSLKRISLAPMTPDQAMSALLRVKPADMKKAEMDEKANKKKK